MTRSVADHLVAARRRRFVGRRKEIALFNQAISQGSSPFFLLHFYGPGGIGKSALLHELASLADEAGVASLLLNAHSFDPAPVPLQEALARRLGVPPGASLQDALAGERQFILLIDTFERLAPIDDWLRSSFLPTLPDNVVVVAAGRNPPGLAWRMDAGWQSVMRSRRLRNLSRRESRRFLELRGVPAAQQRSVLSFAKGYPLALTLVAELFDQRPALEFDPDEAPDVVRTLVEHLVDDVPTPAHRMALEGCAVARLTNEATLAAVLDSDDPHDFLDWLRGLSFVTTGAEGLYLHDLVREAITKDLRWRNLDRYIQIHHRLRRYYLGRLQTSQGKEQRRVLIDYNFLHRDNPTWKPFFDWNESGGICTDQMAPTDLPALVAMVRHHEGGSAAALAERWLPRFPESTLVFRGSREQPAGFVFLLPLESLDPEERLEDPAAAAAWRYLRAHAPLRPGERATLVRFWMAADGYQDVTAVQTRVFLNIAQYYLTTEGLAYTFFGCANPDFWQPVFAYMDLALIPDGAYEQDGRSFGVFGHDWRIRPPRAWLDLLAEREIGMMRRADPPPPTAPPMLVLDQESFYAAVREALRALARPEQLRSSPLLRTRLVSERVRSGDDESERISILSELLTQAVHAMDGTPRDRKFHRALYHTFLQPAPTQERAAELLDLPYSTFRRHLKQGSEQLCEQLWQRELGHPTCWPSPSLAAGAVPQPVPTNGTSG